jgi:hypothetical protein
MPATTTIHLTPALGAILQIIMALPIRRIKQPASRPPVKVVTQKVRGHRQRSITMVNIFRFIQGNTRENGTIALIVIPNQLIMLYSHAQIATNTIKQIWIMITGELADMFTIV